MRKMSVRRAAEAVCEPKRIDFRFSSDDLDKPSDILTKLR
jgi:hypothetical protein